MLFMNRYDIEDIFKFTLYRANKAAPYAHYLKQWCDIVDDNSDGWSHWSGGPRAAKQLMLALQDIRQGKPVDEKALRKALGPIKACATRHKLPCPSL